MKLIIDIPEELKSTVYNCGLFLNPADKTALIDAINNGTPLPKGHGRLIDANSIYQIVRPIEETDDGWGMTGETAIRLIHEAFNRAPTIIEAAKVESEEV